jgi:ABC-type branched-subunit amino acid transport system ATPase component
MCVQVLVLGGDYGSGSTSTLVKILGVARLRAGTIHVHQDEGSCGLLELLSP